MKTDPFISSIFKKPMDNFPSYLSMYDEVDPPAHRPNETFYRPRHNYYLAEEAECVGMCLDKLEVSKTQDGQDLSLWGRVLAYIQSTPNLYSGDQNILTDILAIGLFQESRNGPIKSIIISNTSSVLGRTLQGIIWLKTPTEEEKQALVPQIQPYDMA